MCCSTLHYFYIQIWNTWMVTTLLRYSCRKFSDNEYDELLDGYKVQSLSILCLCFIYCSLLQALAKMFPLCVHSKWSWAEEIRPLLPTWLHMQRWCSFATFGIAGRVLADNKNDLGCFPNWFLLASFSLFHSNTTRSIFSLSRSQ